MEFAVASILTPSGMTLAGKHEAGVLSIGSMTKAGMRSLPLQWSFAEESAAKHGKTVDRKNWRIVMNWHIAESRQEAREQARDGLMRHNNEYTVGTLAAGKGPIYKTPDEAVDDVAFSDESTAVIGTPDDLVAKIHDMMELTGGFGCVIGFVHDWANREGTRAAAGTWSRGTSSRRSTDCSTTTWTRTSGSTRAGRRGCAPTTRG